MSTARSRLAHTAALYSTIPFSVMEPSSPTAIDLTAGETDGAWLQLSQMRKEGKEECGGMPLAENSEWSR